jgi:thiol:disulfide interchange protein DsbC
MTTTFLRRWALGLLMTAWLPMSAAQAADETALARIKAAVERHTAGKVPVTAVHATPIPSLFEVVSGLEVFYVDATGRYGLVDGRLVDMRDSRDLTAVRLESLTRIDFKRLPLDLAIKEVRGDGRRVMAIFEDPGCPVCRVLHKFIAQLPDVTVYRFMFPLTDPQSLPLAHAAWCSKDRKAAWAGLMAGTAAPPPASGPCDTTGLARIRSLGDQLQIQGTPTVFLANGRRLVGATPPEQFIAALDDSSSTPR